MNSSIRIRHREISSERYITLAHSLSLDQVRAAVSRLSPGKRIAIKAKKDALESLAATGRSVTDIENELLTVESVTPFRHCLIARFKGALPDFERLLVKQVYSGLFASYNLDFENTFYEGRLFTFSHEAEVVDWTESEDGRVRYKQLHKIRHPVVIRFYFKSGIALFSYPGFSSAGVAARSSSSVYRSLVHDLVKCIESQCDVRFSTYPVEQCLRLLSRSNNSVLRIVRTDLEPPNGRLNISSAHRVASVEDIFLKSFLGPVLKNLGFTVPEEKLHRAIADVMHEAHTNSMTVSWVEEGVNTRVDFWDIGTELLFVWGRGNSSIFMLEKIVSLIVSVASQLERVDLAGIWTWLSRLEDGAILSIENIVARFNVDVDDVKRVVFQSVAAGVVEPVYRLATASLVLEFDNYWTRNLSDLKGIFTTEDGLNIDGSDPRSVEVAFRRCVEFGDAQ